jgi:hypothetical protein
MNKTQPEDKVLFVCTRQEFLEADRQTVRQLCRQTGLDWELVCSTAKLHGVAPLVYVNLQQCDPPELGIPTAIVDQFKRAYYHSLVLQERRENGLKRALTFFDNNGITVMLIKGVALNRLVYDQPWYTTPHDTDVVLKVKREEISLQDRQEFAQFLEGSGIEFDYFEHHDVTMNGVLPVDFRRVWRDAANIEYGGLTAWVMSAEDLLISACINSCRKRFFRLKSLADIAEILNRCPNLDWDTVTEKARAYDCYNIVYTALLATKITLGCNLPDQALDRLNVNPIRASVVDYLVKRLSLSSFSSLYSGRKLFGRRIDESLILPYSTFRWYQVWRRFAFVLLYTEQGTRRIGART